MIKQYKTLKRDDNQKLWVEHVLVTEKIPT
jgi:hypothetical protein